MANIATPEANRLIDASLTNVEIALCTADPGVGGTLTNEVTAADYVRETVAFSAASGGSASPSADKSWPEATSSWGSITHAALVAKTGETDAGSVRWSGPLTVAKQIDSGDTFKLPAADVVVSLA